MMNRTCLAPALCPLLFAVACGDSTGSDPDPPGPLSPEERIQVATMRAVDDVIVPNVEGFAAATGALDDTVGTLCAGPDMARLEAAQTEWKAVALAWNRVVPFLFGPLDDDVITPSYTFVESMRQRGTNYTNTVRETLDDALGSTEALDNAYFEGLTFNRVGLLALEVLLFESSEVMGDVRSTEPADILTDLVAKPRKCTYLEGMSGLLRRRAERIEAGWTTSFLGGDAYRDLLASGDLPDGSTPTPLFFISTFQHLDYLLNRKLRGQLDAQLSGVFFENLVAGLDALEESLGPDTPDSIFALILETSATHIVTDTRASFNDARAAAAAEDLGELESQMLTLEQAFKNDMPNILGVELGITFTDGD